MTRYDRAVALLDRLQRGPSFSVIVPEDDAMTAVEAMRRVRGWLDSWVIDDVCALIPELREIAKHGLR